MLTGAASISDLSSVRSLVRALEMRDPLEPTDRQNKKIIASTE